MKKKKILGISGSTRKGSSNESILQYIGDTYASGCEMEIFEGIDRLPHFNPDLDNSECLPREVKLFREKLENSDGVIICTPEYVFSLPGCLKNAIEWNVSTTLFSQKPMALIVAAASGEKAMESLELIMKTVEAKINEGATLLIQGAKAKVGKESIKDEVTRKGIERLMKAFLTTQKLPG